MQMAALTPVLIASFPGQLSGVAGSLESALRAISAQAAGAAVTALWQGALLVGSLALCLRLAPRTSAAHRFLLWSAAFVTLVSLPVLALVSSLTSAAVGGAAEAAHVAGSSAWLRLDERWSLVIALLWAAAAIARAASLGIHALRLRGIWKSAVPIDLVDLAGNGRALQAHASAAWGRGTVEICTTTSLQRPSVIGFTKPRILIPDWLFARLTAGELEQIVLHEAEHLRRRDDWTNLLQKICLALFPLNPALVWIERRLCREREMACDDGVISVTHAPRAYAACLASLAERGLERRAEALSLGAWQRRPELVHRVHSILRRQGALSPVATRALLGALSVGLVFGAIELSRCPQLVAFVPAAHIDMKAEAVLPEARLVNAAYYQDRNAQDRNARVVPATLEFKSTNVGLSRAAIRPVRMMNADAPVERVAGRQNDVRAINTSFSEPARPRAAMAKTDLRAAAASEKPETAEQEWIVLTSWETEQVQPATESKGLSADYDAPANPASEDDASAPSGQKPSNLQPSSEQPQSRITVTRLIFRVLPAGLKTPQSGITALRDGWLVIQL
jgi:beta-lactamase regulating signal transducer with metallopeptidase domain